MEETERNQWYWDADNEFQSKTGIIIIQTLQAGLEKTPSVLYPHEVGETERTWSPLETYLMNVVFLEEDQRKFIKGNLKGNFSPTE